MIDEILFPKIKRNPGARSIMRPTGDRLEHRITRRVKGHKNFVYSSSLLSFPSPRNLSEKGEENVTSVESHNPGICRRTRNIFTATPTYCQSGDYLEERDVASSISLYKRLSRDLHQTFTIHTNCIQV